MKASGVLGSTSPWCCPQCRDPVPCRISCSRPARRAMVTFTPISPASRPATQATSMLMGQGVLAKAGAVLQPADQLDQVGVQAVDAQLHHRSSPSRFICSSRSWRHFSTISSMRAGGWIRPSPIGRSSVMRGPPSRRVWSKEDRVMASGVSIDDQIHACSGLQCADVAALAADDAALRFIAGSGTTLTVVSLQWSAAQRLTACPMRLRAMLSQFSFRSVSWAAMRTAFFVGQLLVHLMQQHLAGVLLAQTGQRFQTLHLLGAQSIDLARRSSASAARFFSSSSFFSSASVLRSSAVPSGRCGSPDG